MQPDLDPTVYSIYIEHTFIVGADWLFVPFGIRLPCAQIYGRIWKLAKAALVRLQVSLTDVGS